VGADDQTTDRDAVCAWGWCDSRVPSAPHQLRSPVGDAASACASVTGVQKLIKMSTGKINIKTIPTHVHTHPACGFRGRIGVCRAQGSVAGGRSSPGLWKQELTDYVFLNLLAPHSCSLHHKLALCWSMCLGVLHIFVEVLKTRDLLRLSFHHCRKSRTDTKNTLE